MRGMRLCTFLCCCGSRSLLRGSNIRRTFGGVSLLGCSCCLLSGQFARITLAAALAPSTPKLYSNVVRLSPTCFSSLFSSDHATITRTSRNGQSRLNNETSTLIHRTAEPQTIDRRNLVSGLIIGPNCLLTSSNGDKKRAGSRFLQPTHGIKWNFSPRNDITLNWCEDINFELAVIDGNIRTASTISAKPPLEVQEPYQFQIITHKKSFGYNRKPKTNARNSPSPKPRTMQREKRRNVYRG